MARGSGIEVSIRRKRFTEKGAVLFADFAFAAAPGEVVALIGPSGVGKTTLLRLIGGIDRDFEGSITIDGLPTADAPLPGFVFQDARLLPWLDVAANIRAVRPDIPDAEIHELLGRVGLDDRAADYPHQLSGGMQRRLGLARALSVGPALLLLDEPFVSLDRRIVSELQKLFNEVFDATNATAIIVSHDPADAARLADRAVLLAGRPMRTAFEIGIDIPRADRTPVDVAAWTERIETASMEAAE